MQRKQLSKFLILTALLVSTPPGGAALAGESTGSASRLWPLPIKINLTSSFGEYRSGHLHAGIDIKTYGQEGVPCRAVDSGHVGRLRASPNGYGKAVYLKLDSGETVVYAHLSEFSPELERYIYDQQKRLGRYRVDLYPEPHEFPVRRADIIGYSGSTGASAPHLHFEVRDGQENPMNPLSIGWELEDEQGPRFSGVLFVPLSKSARIEGRCLDRVVKLRRTGNVYTTRDTLTLQGRVGLAAYIVDRLNESSGRLAPHRVELSIDGVPASSIELERFTYGHTREVELAYAMDKVRTGGGHYLVLFRRKGETLWNRSFADDGVIDCDRLQKRRVHTATIRAIDRGGNECVATIPFYAGSDRVVSERRLFGNRGDNGRLEGCFFFDDLLSIDESVVLGDLGGGPATYLVEDVGEPRQLQFATKGQRHRVHVLPVKTDAHFGAELPDLRLSLSTFDQSLFGDAFLFVQAWDGEETDVAAGLEPRTRPIRLGPSSVAMRKGIELRFELPDSADGREAVYQLSVKGNTWVFASSEVRGDTCVAVVRSPGVYGVFVDSEPPEIGQARVASKRSHATGQRFHEVAIPLKDAGSGVNGDDTEVYLNGKKQIARWDGFSGRIFVMLRDDSPEGAALLRVAAKDRVGNSVTIRKPIELPTRMSGGSGTKGTSDRGQ